MRLFIAGNSHVAALARAQKGRDGEGSSGFDETRIFPLGPASFELAAFSRVAGRAVEFIEEDARLRLAGRSGMTRIEPGDEVWCLCLGLHTINIVKHPFWRTNHPVTVAANDAAPVSTALCRAIVAAAQDPVRQFLLHLRAAGVPSFAMSSPPLRRDHPASQTCPPLVALELDRLAREEFKAFLEGSDIDFVDHPAEARAEDGFLREDLNRVARDGAEPDHHHANATYGAWMLDRVLRHAEMRYLSLT